MIEVTGLDYVQDQGTYATESVIVATGNLTANDANSGHTFDMEAQFALTSDHPAYARAVLHPKEVNGSIKHTEVPAGSFRFLVRVPASLSGAGMALADYMDQLVIQVRAKDRATQEYSEWASSGAVISMRALRPVVTTATMPHYIGNINVNVPVQFNNVQMVVAGTRDGAPLPVRVNFRVSMNSADLADGATTPFRSGEGDFYSVNGGLRFVFSANEPDGEKSVLVRVYDEYYNSSVAAEFTHDGTPGHLPWLQKAGPRKVGLHLIGTTGQEEYTGISIDPATGAFTANRHVEMVISAQSPLPMTFRIKSSGSNIETIQRTDPITGLGVAENIDQDIVHNSDQVMQHLWLTTDAQNPAIDDAGTDASVSVEVEVKDAAGNTVNTVAITRLNTRIYLTHNRPLRAESPAYDHRLYEVAGNNQVPVDRKVTLESSTRAWPDIFYPAAHSYRADEWGNILESDAILMNGSSDSFSDAVLVKPITGSYLKQLDLDDDGRPQMSQWTIDGTKNYSGMLSSHPTNLTYWVLNNRAYGDFRLDFEYFDLNPNGYGPPYNALAPYRGDVLVVYDATAPGAMTATTDPVTGKTTYVLADSGKLVEIAAYTSGGQNVVNLTNGMRVGSNIKGGFRGDWIRGIPLVLVMLYTDAAGNASGFRLKSGVRHDRTWDNWDVDERNGEIWVHKHTSSGGSVNGAADPSVKRAIYDYLDRDVQINLQTGIVTFAEDPAGTVTADYSYYLADTCPVTTLLAGEDDFVNHREVFTYIAKAGREDLDDETRTTVYEEGLDYGRVTTKVSWDKDTGVVEFAALGDIPAGRRIFAEYTHHTYKRLSNDGYDDTHTLNNGDLTFVNPIIVADTTTSYPDYTYQDVKVSNEGDATLEGAKITFVPRGYDTDGQDGVVLTPDANSQYKTVSDIVDQVLDINRPWDIQKGTKEETYDRMAMAVNANYIWSRSCPRTDPDNANKGAEGILSSWKNKAFGNLPARSHVYGRVVWVLGPPYPANVTANVKRCSLELEGKYYSDLIL